MMENNNVELLFEARSENEAFARVVAAAFVTYLDPTIEELQDIKTAVSEAVTNAIVHGYYNGPGKVRMRFSFMEAFMDDLRVASAPGKGTTVLMRKKIGE